MKKKSKFVSSLIDKPQELAQYLDLALEGANLGIWDWNLKNNSVWFDRRWAEMLGLDFSKIEMKLETWESRVHPDDLEKAYADIKAYMDGEMEFYENIHRMKHANGHWVYILDRGRFSEWDKDGKPTRFTGTHFDITNSERFRKKLSIFFENSPFGYAFCDMQGNLLEINNRYAEITGYSLEELKKLSYWEITPKKYEKEEALQLKSMLEIGKYGPYRKEYIRKDGRVIPIELNGFIVEDYDGITGIWSTVEDITEKKLLEKQLLHSSKLASVGTLAAGVGHEINNPLAIIKLRLERLKSENKANVSLMKDISLIDNAVDRITKIVAGLRTFSQSDNAEYELVNIKNSLEEATCMFDEVLKGENLKIQKNYTNFIGTPFVNGFHGRLQQVFVNLITNAKDATKGKELRQINIELNKRDNFVEIVFSDNGCGITEENIAKIFDPFFTTKEVNEGTGIGLSIVHNIVAEHGGSINVESAADRGTRFFIQLPLSEVKPDDSDLTQPIRQNPKLKSTSKKLKGRVLLAEDEPEFRNIMCELICELGIEVEAYSNGQLAYSEFIQNPEKYDIIISDVKMANGDGLSFLQKVRNSKVQKPPKFVFITGGVDANVEGFLNKHNLKLDGFIHKPFRFEQVSDLLNQFLGDVESSSKEELKKAC